MSQKIKTSVEIDGSLTANSIVKSGGTSSQILAANGSVVTAGSGVTISGGIISASGSAGVTSFNTRTGAVTLTSGDVTTALGYTPYNASNPAGYISSYTETDTLASVTSRGAVTTSDIFTPNNGGIFFNGNSAYGSGIFGRNFGQDLAFNSGGVERIRLNSLGNFGLGTASPISGGGSAKWITIDGTASYGGGVVSSVNGSAKAYYYFDGTNAVIQGASGVGISFQPNNSSQATLNTSGDFTVNSSLRAPIFYDSNDTSYYTNPASTSVLSSVVLRGASAISFYGAGNGTYNIGSIYSSTSINSWEAPLETDSYTAARVPFILTWRGGYSAKGGLKLTGDASGELGGNVILHAGNYSSYAVPTSRTITINGTSYDLSANRSWTVTGTETDTLQTVTSRGNTSSNPIILRTSYPYMQFEDTVTGTTKFAWQQLGVTLAGSGAGGGGYFTTYSQDKPFGWTVGGNQGVMTIDTSGNVQALTSSRAPIFYDSNNTGYYVDPAGMSYLDRLVVNNSTQANNLLTIGGTFSGDWQSLTNTTGQANWVQVENIAGGAHSNYPSGVYTYGGVLSFRGSSHSFQLYSSHTGDLAFKTQWGNDNYSGWRNILHTGNYASYSNFGGNAVYGGIFYDGNNTGYYGDFASTSRQYQAISFGDSTRYSAINTTINGAGAGDKLILYGDTFNYDARLLVGADYDMLFKSQGNSAGKGSFKFYSGLNSALALTIDGYQNTSINGSLSVSGGSSWFGGYGGGSGPGLAFENQNTFARIVFWGLDFYDWNHGTQMVIDNGYVLANNSMRSPIFYDSNDTGYYGDFASTSNFRNLLLNNQTTINTTTPGLTSYGLTFMGGNSDQANGMTWTWGNTNAQAGIYVQSSGAYGTKMYFATTDSFATGAKTAMAIDHSGNVSLNRGTFSNGSVWINNGVNYNSYNENIRLFNATNGVSVIAFGASGTSGTPQSSILGFSDRLEIRVGSNGTAVQRNYDNYVEAMGSSRAPIFYDSNNTGYYLDPASLSNVNSIAAGNYIFANAYLETNGPVYGTVFYDNNNRSYYCDPSATSNFIGLTVANTINGNISGNANTSNTDYLMSDRDFPSGTLIQTSINYNNSEGDPFVLEIKGNSYGNGMPMDVQIQGYIYANTIINTGGYSNGFNVSGIRAIRYNGNLCFWFPTQGYWNGYTVKAYTAYGGRQVNKVTSVTNTGLPTTDKQVNFTPAISLRSDNYRGYSDFSGAVYGTIFYDADNTGYYIDPTAISNINNLQIAGGLQVGSGYASSIDMVDIDHGTRTIHCNSNRIGFLNQSSSWGSWCEDNGSWVNETSMNSPIFYDYNNTGYYVDPSNISNLFEANFGDNSNGNQGINIYYGNQTGGYGKIRFYQAGSNHQTIHSFSANWQGGGFGSGNSANAINIDGAAGVTFGGWNVPDAYIAKGGNFWCRYDVIAYSDARVKDNVEVITNALDKIKKVRGVTFTRNDYEDKEKRHTGVIAQEMLEALPEAVTKDSDGMYSVSYGNLAGLFIEAIKEQQTQIEELKELVNKLINK